MGFKQWWTGKEEPDFSGPPVPKKEQVNTYVAATDMNNHSFGPAFGNASITINLDKEQQKKWYNFFVAKLQEIADPAYKQLQLMVDAMGVTIPTQTAYPTVFAGLAATGMKKSVLLAGTQTTIDALTANSQDFTTHKEQQRQEQVIAVRTQALEKQKQIEKLQQEINDLNTAAQLAEVKINTSILGYNTYHAQALAKISNDLRSITSFIPDNG